MKDKNQSVVSVLLREDSLVKEFKSFVKENIKGYGKKWASVNRQINRVLGYVRGNVQEKRSGIKTDYLNELALKFIEEKAISFFKADLVDIGVFITANSDGWKVKSPIIDETFRGTFLSINEAFLYAKELVDGGVPNTIIEVNRDGYSVYATS